MGCLCCAVLFCLHCDAIRNFTGLCYFIDFIFLMYVPRFLSVVDLLLQICLNYCSNFIKFFHTEYLKVKFIFPYPIVQT